MRFTLRLPHKPDSIPAARRELQRLEGAVDDMTLRNTKLLVSELVTNAVRHVPAGEGDEIELVVERPDDCVRVEVADHGPGFDPSQRPEAASGSSGWGLHIMDKLATRWGVEVDGGARVWFGLETPVRSASDPSAATATGV